MKSKKLSIKKVKNVIKKLASLNKGNAGECANFAIALNRILGTRLMYVGIYKGKSTKNFSHVLLELSGNKFLDSSGIISIEEAIDMYGNDGDVETNWDYLGTDLEYNEKLIIKGTSGGDMSKVNDLVSQYLKKYKY